MTRRIKSMPMPCRAHLTYQVTTEIELQIGGEHNNGPWNKNILTEFIMAFCTVLVCVCVRGRTRSILMDSSERVWHSLKCD